MNWFTSDQHFNHVFVGHVHEKWKFMKCEHGDMVNVGVDQWDFYPIDPKQIFKAYKTWTLLNQF